MRLPNSATHLRCQALPDQRPPRRSSPLRWPAPCVFPPLLTR